MYIYVSSHQSNEYFTDNTAVAFRVRLPKRLNLQQSWEWSLAILDISLPKFTDEYKTDYITINSRTCEPSIVNTALQPILNRIFTKELQEGSPVTFDTPRYVRLTQDILDTVDIYLTDSQGRAPSFTPGHVSCTLHLTEGS